MRGSVINRRPSLPVVFRLPSNPDLTIEFVIDTGFTEFMALPPRVIAAMKLPFLLRDRMMLADANVIEVNIHVATIVWHGTEYQVPVLATGRRPLLGTALLDKSELLIQFTEDGFVTVDPL